MNTPESDHQAHLYTSRRRVLACATVLEEIQAYLPADVAAEVLDFGLHLRPENLKRVLQQKIDEISPYCDVVLLGYGLCSMAVVGLQARAAFLVIPRVDDCIGIFLGSCQNYKAEVLKEPGTYYLTKGWIDVADTPFEEHKRLVEKFGVEKANRMTRLMLRNYQRLALINTGNYEIDQYRDYARSMAESFNLRFEEIKGSSSYVEKMITGPWNEDFLVVAPGEYVRYSDFMQGKRSEL